MAAATAVAGTGVGLGCGWVPNSGTCPGVGGTGASSLLAATRAPGRTTRSLDPVWLNSPPLPPGGVGDAAGGALGAGEGCSVACTVGNADGSAGMGVAELAVPVPGDADGPGVAEPARPEGTIDDGTPSGDVPPPCRCRSQAAARACH